jgi:hypothetical protein
MPLEFTPVTRAPSPPGWPWARTRGEIEQMTGVLSALVATVSENTGRTVEELTRGERYTLGVRAAARWTTGLSDVTPLTGRELPTSRELAETELGVADFLTHADGPVRDGAAGVYAWLRWLLGHCDRMVFLALTAAGDSTPDGTKR